MNAIYFLIKKIKKKELNNASKARVCDIYSRTKKSKIHIEIFLNTKIRFNKSTFSFIRIIQLSVCVSPFIIISLFFSLIIYIYKQYKLNLF